MEALWNNVLILSKTALTILFSGYYNKLHINHVKIVKALKNTLFNF